MPVLSPLERRLRRLADLESRLGIGANLIFACSTPPWRIRKAKKRWPAASITTVCTGLSCLRSGGCKVTAKESSDETAGR